jgi:hypothetical protein
MKVKIISDGTSKGTKIINAETGETIENVRGATWKCSVGHLAEVILDMINIPVEIEGKTIKEEKNNG